jgi:hypothetical protein
MEHLRRARTSQEDWTRSDEYHNSLLISKDDGLKKTLEHSRDEGLDDMAVSAAQGKFLKLLALSIGAKRILEVGTLGGCTNFSFYRCGHSDRSLDILPFGWLKPFLKMANFLHWNCLRSTRRLL